MSMGCKWMETIRMKNGNINDIDVGINAIKHLSSIPDMSNAWDIVNSIRVNIPQYHLEKALYAIRMAMSIPMQRICSELKCMYHHPDDPNKTDYSEVCRGICDKCKRNMIAAMDGCEQDFYKS